MPFDRITALDADPANLVGSRFASEADFLKAYLGEVGVSAERSEFLDNHTDQMGAWAAHLQPYRLNPLRARLDIRTGDLFFAYQGGRRWRMWIVTEHREHKPFYMDGRIARDPVKHIWLEDGIVTERPSNWCNYAAHFRFAAQINQKGAA